MAPALDFPGHRPGPLLTVAGSQTSLSFGGDR